MAKQWQMKEHGSGNRDLNRFITGHVPSMGYGLLSLPYINQMAKLPQNTPLLNEIINQQVHKIKGLESLKFTFPKVFDGLPKTVKNLLTISMNRYNPATKTLIHSGHTGLAAHEFGHAQQYANPKYAKYAAPFAKLSRIAGRYGALAPIFTDKESEARRNSMIASGLNIPMIAEEFDASRRGSKLLKTTQGLVKYGGKASKLKNLLMLMSPYAGMPTYLLQAALPWLIYKYMKKRGKYGGKYESKTKKT